MQPIHGLACPACRGPLDQSGEALTCAGCASTYRIVDGIPTFEPEPSQPPSSCELSVLILAAGPADGTPHLAGDISRELQALGTSHEIQVVDGESSGYGHVLRDALAAARGEYVLTLDADGSHDSRLIPRIWHERHRGEVVIASRYVPGGRAEMPRLRRFLSRSLNLVYRRGLSLPFADVSSGFRLYRRRALQGLTLRSANYDVLAEILVRVTSAGYAVAEVPFHYRTRRLITGRRRLKLILSYVKTFGSMWKLRNSIASADYDARAFDSIVPLQRYWQRRRYRLITRMAAGASNVLDVGCGSSRIIGSRSLVALDISLAKLRYARRFANPVVQGSIFRLPFENEAFDCVICSEVIEHVPADEKVFSELDRVLEPGGRLILGTPDYGRWRWRALEWLYRRISPGGYADEHITHYSRANLTCVLASRGLTVEAVHYVGGSEMIFSLRKADGRAGGNEPLPAAAGLHRNR